jgi:DNA repair exonuclease SbcCD ATPase subunit
MKRINFKKISIKNFLSFGETPVILEFKKGLHIITGINRDKSDRQNGLGKSAMMESLYFAIFGTTIRDLKKDLIPNAYTNGVCEVVLEFDIVADNNTISYKLIRTLNPSKLFLYKEDVDITRDSIKNTESYLHEILHATPSIFENCVIMTLNNTIPFMAKSNADKKKFIENIFNLDVFSRMLSKLKEENSDKKREYEIELTKMEDSERSLNNLKIQKETILSNKKNKISTYEQRKESNLKEKNKLLEDLTKTISINIEEIRNDLKKIKREKENKDKQILKLNEQKFQLASEITHQENSLKKIGTSEDNCPVCLRSIQEHDKETIENEIKKISENIDNQKILLKDIVEKIETGKKNKKLFDLAIDRYNEKINTFLINEQNVKNINDRIKQLDSWLEQLSEDINELKSEFTETDPFIEKQTLILDELKTNVNKCRYMLNLMDTVKFIVSEEGVKSYIVKKVLLMFNDRIRHYLSQLDANCICTFNEYFEEEIINEKNKPCSYFNFSGAERKNIDFSCLFTFMDMRRIQGNVTYNISIYDELFDSCLDERGIELVTKIIKDRVERYDECVLVISHRKDSINSATGDVIFLEKENNITKKIDYNPFS